MVAVKQAEDRWRRNLMRAAEIVICWGCERTLTTIVNFELIIYGDGFHPYGDPPVGWEA